MDYLEGIAVMLFYQIGEWFQSYAVGRSRKNIGALMDIRPDYANIERDGKLEKVDPDDVALGTTIVVQPGERVPLDGVVLRGTSSLNTSALTGESLPRDVQQGDEVISGCINMTGVLYVKTTKESEAQLAMMVVAAAEIASSILPVKIYLSVSAGKRKLSSTISLKPSSFTSLTMEVTQLRVLALVGSSQKQPPPSIHRPARLFI